MAHFKLGEGEAIYLAAEKVKADREQNKRDREKHGRYRMRTKNVKVLEADALVNVQDGLRLCKKVDHVKIWHGNEAPKNEEGISDILGVVSIPVQALVEAGIQDVGVAIAMEVKGSETATTGKQIMFLERWRKKGAIVGIVREFLDCEALVDEFCKGADLEGPK